MSGTLSSGNTAESADAGEFGNKSAKTLRILLLEDNPDDAFIIERTLNVCRVDYIAKRVDCEREFVAALETFAPDAVLSDFHLPKYDIFCALDLSLARLPGIPFLVVSGQIGEERAVECIVRGATDYVMKDRIERLPYALDAALAVAHERRLRLSAQRSEKESHEILKQMSENVSEVLFVTSADYHKHYFISSAFDRIWGFSREVLQIRPRAFLDIVIEDDLPLVLAAIDNASAGFEIEFRIVKAGQIRWLSATAAPIQESMLTGKVCGVMRDITELKAAQELAQQEIIQKQRADIIASLTHDLKNPLLGANRIFDLFVKGVFGSLSAEQVDIIQQLRDSNRRLLALIQNMLEASRFDAEPLKLTLEPVDMKEVVEKCLLDAALFAQSRGVVINFEASDLIPPIQGERESLYRVVQNLVDNSIKYGSSNSSVDVNLNWNEHLQFTIKDTGPGIAESEQGDLFQRYGRTSAGMNSKTSTGLGLYLCRQIVEAHQGHIECISEKGKGSMFAFSLPFDQAKFSPKIDADFGNARSASKSASKKQNR